MCEVIILVATGFNVLPKTTSAAVNKINKVKQKWSARHTHTNFLLSLEANLQKVKQPNYFLKVFENIFCD